MAAVTIRFKPGIFDPGGKFEKWGDVRHKVRWHILPACESKPHADINVWWHNDGYPQPVNSVAIVIKGESVSWFDSADEFNKLAYSEIRAQIANGIDRGILEVRSTAGAAVSADDVRNGAVT